VPPSIPDSAGYPALSVITPAYNVQPYVAACIESVLGQTFSNLELIVVDDGSTDDTASVIAKYARLDRRVRAFRGPNRGVSHARNVAMKQAGGRYFAFVDADDQWAPTFAATLVGLLERTPEVAIVTGNALNLGGGRLDGQPVRPWPAEPRELHFIDLIQHEDSVFIMSVFRREVFDAVGPFNEGLHRSEDYEFWLRAAAAGFRIVTHPEPLGIYRRRHDSATADDVAMLEAVMAVVKSARGLRHRPRAEELAAIDAQLERLSAAHLLTKGKTAFLRRDFVEARSHFWELYRRGKGLPFAAASLALRIAPRAALAAYRARCKRQERHLRMSSSTVLGAIPNRPLPSPPAS
jgi:glycosyltransferase involved in cell wall biosynthesis